MSGNNGFSGGGVESDPGYSEYRNSGFGSAWKAYDAGSARADPPKSRAGRPPAGASATAPAAILPKVELGVRPLTFTAENALIVAVDTTTSMAGWPLDIFDRLGLGVQKARDLFRGPVQVLIIGFGDIPECGDPFEVTPIGEGPELLGYLAAIQKVSRGGPNEVESADLVLAFADSMVDVSRCKNVFTFVLTDEMVREVVDFGKMTPWRNQRGEIVPARPVVDVVRSLRICQHVFAIIKPYGSVRELQNGEDPMTLYKDRMSQKVLRNWDQLLGEGWVARLWDSRRIIDVILGCIASRLGKSEEFMRDFRSRQMTASHGFGPINIRTVEASLSSIGGTVLKPITRSRSLLVPGSAAPTALPSPPRPKVIDVSVVSSGPPQPRTKKLLAP